MIVRNRLVVQSTLTQLTLLVLSAGAGAGQLWVSNTPSHALSIIDTESQKVIETKIPVGKAPHGMAYLP